MQRRNQFITAAVTAALTFGVLTLTLGQRHYSSWYGHHHDYAHGRYHDSHENCDDHNHEKQKNDSSQNEL